MFEWSLPLWADFGVLLAAAAVIGGAGVKSSEFADRLADRTGLGEAVTGTVFLGFLTALPGLVASVVAGMQGHAGLAINNAMGGIAAQTAALGVADIAYRKANLEHAAASVPNMMQAIMLILLLTIVMAGFSSPDVTVGTVHPVSIVLVLVAACAFWMVWRTRAEPMWRPKQTRETVEDEPHPAYQIQNLPKLILGLLITASLTGISGAAVATAAGGIVEDTVLSDAVVGGLMMAIATSLPELVTSVASVRRGALTLAVSNIVGGNFFDVLFVAAADVAYVAGSLYHGENIGPDDSFLTVLTILLNVVLLIGLIYRQKRGPANIGFESLSMLLLYIGGFLVLALAM